MNSDAVITALERFFREHAPGAAAVYLFGSTARGEARAGSDLDVAVLWVQQPPHTLEGAGLRLEGELERALRLPVDLVVLNRAPLDLVHRVLRDGILAYEGDHNARVNFEVDRRRAYLDFKPVLDRYRRAPAADHG